MRDGLREWDKGNEKEGMWGGGGGGGGGVIIGKVKGGGIWK